MITLCPHLRTAERPQSVQGFDKGSRNLGACAEIE